METIRELLKKIARRPETKGINSQVKLANAAQDYVRIEAIKLLLKYGGSLDKN